MKARNRSQRGFTLLEIMIAGAIIGLLASMALPNVIRARENLWTKTCVNNLRQLDGAKDQAAVEQGVANGGDVSAFVGQYMKKGLPKCPSGDTDYLLKEVGVVPECNSPAKLEHNNAYSP